MANELLPKIDYSSRDFSAILSDIRRLFPYFLPEMTDLNPSNPAIALAEIDAAIADQLHFYVDRMINEFFLDTALRRRNVQNILRLIDYEIPSAEAAVVTLKFTLGSIYSDPILIPAGTQYQTSGLEEDIYFETIKDLIISAGDLYNSVDANEGRTISEEIGISDGTSYQFFNTDSYPVIDDSLQIFVNEGGGYFLWYYVDNFANSNDDDKHYTIQKDEYDRAIINFGDNGHGKIPVKNSSIMSIYRIGGGEDGNVESGVISVINSSIIHKGNQVSIEVINEDAAEGGEERQSIDTAKKLGPLSLRTLGKAVTLEDFEILSLKVSGVGKAQAKNTGYNEVTIYIFGSGGISSTNALKAKVKEYFDGDGNSITQKRLCTLEVLVESGFYIDPWIEGYVKVFPNYKNANVEQSIIDALQTFFDFESQEFGITDDDIGNLNTSDIISIIRNVDGVDYFNPSIISMRPNITKEVWSGDADFVDDAWIISNNTIKETWTINFTSPTKFSVQGSISGIQSNIGTIENLYQTDGDTPKLIFKIENNGSSMQVGDRCNFRVSGINENIEVNNTEIITPSLDSSGLFKYINLTLEGGA